MIWKHGKELGYRRKRLRASQETAPPCVVCGQAGMYNDPDWGRLCRRHGMSVRDRRRTVRKHGGTSAERRTAALRPLRPNPADYSAIRGFFRSAEAKRAMRRGQPPKALVHYELHRAKHEGRWPSREQALAVAYSRAHAYAKSHGMRMKGRAR